MSCLKRCAIAEIYDSIRSRIDCRQKIKPKSDRLVASWRMRPQGVMVITALMVIK
jgi:hypothetical protein